MNNITSPRPVSDETIEQARAAEVVALIRRGELSRATQRLASPGIAQGSAEVEQRLREMLGVNAPTPMPPASPDGAGLDNATGLDFDTAGAPSGATWWRGRRLRHRVRALADGAGGQGHGGRALSLLRCDGPLPPPGPCGRRDRHGAPYAGP